MHNLHELLKIKEQNIPHTSTGLSWAKSVNGKPNFGGIYIFWWKGNAEDFLESIEYPQLHFHGPGGVPIPFTVDKTYLHTAGNGLLPLYIGKNAANIAKRIGLHLKLGTKRTVPSSKATGIAKRMTTSCQVRDRIDRLFPKHNDTRPIALNNLALSYTKIHGNNNFAKRFFLEDLAIGKLKPIFNVDSER
jgi:hypothetical protein